MNKNTSLADWLTYIEQAHTKEIDMGLSRTKDLVNRLNIDLAQQCVVTVGGTNGKGTTCALIEQVCLQAGLTVGVYSSPHLVSFCERIRLNGSSIAEALLCDVFAQIDDARNDPQQGSVELTYFEFATLAAVKVFSEQKLDVIILEVGLGGRLDAVNVIDADVAVITSIGLDHQDWLGNTKEKIAFEKAGIFRADKPAIIGEANPQASMLGHARSIGATLVCRGKEFDFDEDSSIARVQGHAFSTANAKIPKQNVATALAAINAISQRFALVALEDPEDNVVALQRKALKLIAGSHPFLAPIDQIQAIIDETQVLGRHHMLRTAEKGQHCAVMLDVAHNEDSAQQLSRLIRTYPFDTCHIVVGMLKDKNIEVSLQAFTDLKAHWYCSSLPTARGAQAERLVAAVQSGIAEHDNAKAVASQHARGSLSASVHVTMQGSSQEPSKIEAFETVDTAFEQALHNARPTDIILVMGSFLTVAAVLKYHASA